MGIVCGRPSNFTLKVVVIMNYEMARKVRIFSIFSVSEAKATVILPNGVVTFSGMDSIRAAN